MVEQRVSMWSGVSPYSLHIPIIVYRLFLVGFLGSQLVIIAEMNWIQLLGIVIDNQLLTLVIIGNFNVFLMIVVMNLG